MLNGTSLGIDIGQKLGSKYPKTMLTIAVCFFLLLGALGWYDVSRTRHYKRLQLLGDAILQAEETYYAQEGHFTADLDQLKLPDFPPLLEKEYKRGKYVYEGETLLEQPAVFTGKTQDGDEILIYLNGGIKPANPSALNFSPILEIRVSAHSPALPAGYTVLRRYGPNDSPDPIKICEVPVSHNNLTPSDLQARGSLCQKAGAQPTDNPTLWVF